MENEEQGTVIVGIGIDIVEVSRFESWAADAGMMERFFHPDEIDAVRGRGRGMVRSLAARFAAKEAFGKALGTGLAGIVLKDIMVANQVDERPVLTLAGTALRAFRAAGAEKAHLSLSHEKTVAAAMVVLEA